jgi:hypothetical protein
MLAQQQEALEKKKAKWASTMWDTTKRGRKPVGREYIAFRRMVQAEGNAQRHLPQPHEGVGLVKRQMEDSYR